jgi:plasmid stability protein
MTQLTIRRLNQSVIDGLKKRAAAAGRSMEEEARTILSEAIVDDQLERQRAWADRMKAKRHELFGDKVFSDSTEIIRRMRDDRTRVNASWISSSLPEKSGRAERPRRK